MKVGVYRIITINTILAYLRNGKRKFSSLQKTIFTAQEKCKRRLFTINQRKVNLTILKLITVK